VPVDKIYLVGFMAAGKSTVARALSSRLGWRAEDVDELIEARERRTIADIFARQGEPYFRGVEREILKLLLPLRHVVVATGEHGTKKRNVLPPVTASMRKSVLVLLPWFDVQNGLIGDLAMPHGLISWGSVIVASPGTLETRLCCTYWALAGGA